MRSGAGAALGVIPLGSGDDFAKLLQPGSPAARLARNSVRRFDVGRIRGGKTCHFVNGMDLGFGAHAARNVAAVQVSRARILRLVPKIMRGAHAGEPDLSMPRAKRVLVESDTPLVVEAGGEIVFEDARRLEIEVLPRALAVID